MTGTGTSTPYPAPRASTEQTPLQLNSRNSSSGAKTPFEPTDPPAGAPPDEEHNEATPISNTSPSRLPMNNPSPHTRQHQISKIGTPPSREQRPPTTTQPANKNRRNKR